MDGHARSVQRSRSQGSGTSTVAQLLLKLTFGACCADAGASKNGYSLKPNTPAVMFAGKRRRDVL